MTKNFDWITDPTWLEIVKQAWAEYECNPEIHLLYRYQHLVDEASIAIGVVDPSELRAGAGGDQAPSLNETW